MSLAGLDVLEEGAASPSAHTLSLLSARRPSLAGPGDPLSSFHIPGSTNVDADDDYFRSPISESLDDNPLSMPDFGQRLQIKMQGWVGDGVGKVSVNFVLPLDIVCRNYCLISDEHKSIWERCRPWGEIRSLCY